MQNEENAYKTDANEAAYKLVGDTREEIKREALSMAEKLNDPVILGALMYRTVQEKENANRLLKSILEKIDAKFAQMDERIGRLEEKLKTENRMETEMAGEEILLPKQDEDILGLVRRKGHVCAEEVRKEFGYKGPNAASARLSKLYQMGLLQKQQVGRRVYYKMK
ncbi:Uncharacterised protein [Candidatus Anstonella stagnisolia]|nr:Uncharacterised protein [Candidatus Anstonella stagnisolia]